MDLKNKVAIVTGAGRGIGYAIAEKLALCGASVALADISEQNAREAVEKINAAGAQAAAFVGDTADPGVVELLFADVLERFGQIDILVNNAGINRDAMLHKMDHTQWDDVIRVNLSGYFYCTQQAAKLMREAGYGRIVNIASASIEGNIGQANYAAAKAGVVGLTKTAAKELARKGITANAICPGFIETEMTKSIPEKAWDMMVGKIPMGYVGKPVEVANLVAFLASDEAAYITGEVIYVGGGFKL